MNFANGAIMSSSRSKRTDTHWQARRRPAFATQAPFCRVRPWNVGLSCRRLAHPLGDVTGHDRHELDPVAPDGVLKVERPFGIVKAVPSTLRTKVFYNLLFASRRRLAKLRQD